MSGRVTLLTSAPTAATASAAFSADEPLDARGRAWAAAGRGRVPRVDRVRHAPERAARQTCEILGLTGDVDRSLRGWDVGRWAGRRLDDLAADRPDDVSAWLTDPTATPHGGEALTVLLARVRQWLAALPAGHTLVVCDPAFVRGAVVSVLDAPPSAFWRVDVAPMTLTDLRGGPDRWTVRTTALPLRGGD
ncbi:histidine phosphatase family protein [Pseudonocardia xinjiangensis]|uniref:Histidine phosphatase family protein n=1 Tax=Pseudonocardia xinjiangensis TaxID=75289 RepID=A0ABX1RBV5_9PSEU|nr:histidine phosphatase family protein [Pseudonocardia xinjiangensis]NMH77863.1 histidine phosphatase family protein [Pseudonocardia xinjiangensis]